LQPGADYNPFIIHHIRITRNKRNCRPHTRIHDIHQGWGDNLRTGNNVNILGGWAEQDDRVTRLELVQVAEQFTEDVIVRGKDDVTRLAWIGGKGMLPHTLF
jgi:hypothetical protein